MERNESRHGGYKAELVVSTLAIIKRVCLGICQVSRIVVPIDHKVNFKPKSRLIERRGLASRRQTGIAFETIHPLFSESSDPHGHGRQSWWLFERTL